MIEQNKQNDINELAQLAAERYENIFNVYTQSKGNNRDEYFYYNILRKITIDETNIDPDVFAYISIAKPIPWTTISYDNYGTQHLWWLILAINNITNPLELPTTGSTYKIIKREYINSILEQLEE